MPGRPRRDITFERIIKQNPGLAISLGKKLPELTTEENLLLYKSIVNGLLKRISLLKPAEAEALSKSLPRLRERFAAGLVLDSPAQASKDIVTSLSKLSIPQLNRCLIEPIFLELAHLASALVRTMPSRNEVKKRRDWVEKYGLNAGHAAESDGTLVEHILAHNYKISESRVHKILADASKLLRSPPVFFPLTIHSVPGNFKTGTASFSTSARMLHVSRMRLTGGDVWTYSIASYSQARR